MEIVYLVQGSRKTLAGQDFGGAAFYTLCYEGDYRVDTAAGCLASTTASWAEGRNMLLDAALSGHPNADYYVFCDDDVEFLSGDFGLFEKGLETTRPALGFPLMPKARLGAVLDETLTVQRAYDIDEQMYAVHRSILGTVGIAPLETRYDQISWYVSSMAFEYAAATLISERAHQYNTVELCNNGHVWETGETLYATSRGVPAEFVPVFHQYAEWVFGNYDPYVIAQFMPPLSAEAHEAYTAKRRECLTDLLSFDHRRLGAGSDEVER